MDPELTAFLTQRFDEIGRQFVLVDQRFTVVNRRFDAMDQRFETLDRRFDAMDQRFDAMDQRFETMDQRFDAMDQRFETMDRRFDATDQRLDHTRTELGALVEGLRDEVRQIAEGHALLDRKLDRFRDENETAHREILGLLRSSYRDLDHRVSRLESRIPDEGGPAR